MSDVNATTRQLGHQRALKILAKSVYRELRSSGYNRTDIVGFTNELLDLVTDDLRDGQAAGDPSIS